MLAWLQQEPGSSRVGRQLEDGVVTAANWAEILQKSRQYGADPDEVGVLLRSLGVDIVDVTRLDGETAAALWERSDPLPLGDRLCLAVAIRLRLPVLTTDRLWGRASLEGVEVEVLRGK